MGAKRLLRARGMVGPRRGRPGFLEAILRAERSLRRAGLNGSKVFVFAFVFDLVVAWTRC